MQELFQQLPWVGEDVQDLIPRVPTMVSQAEPDPCPTGVLLGAVRDGGERQMEGALSCRASWNPITYFLSQASLTTSLSVVKGLSGGNPRE